MRDYARSRLGMAVAWGARLRRQRGLSRRWRHLRHYFPLSHPTAKISSVSNVVGWLKDHIAAGARIVTQNGLYDWGWLGADLGVAMPPSDQLEEIGALVTLIDENRLATTSTCSGSGAGCPARTTTLLEEAVKAAGFKMSKKTPLQAYIWQMPAGYVGPYAEADAANTLALFEKLNSILDREQDARRLSP